ncbi:hypothetical protein HK098_003558 [Nowakowskiella sp. JEL0407]|nr:hypothetical protein HK098_003558 [Nowakowskiella sp. JEL0407]
MSDHKQRAERRKKFLESRLIDPTLLLRITGSSIKPIPNAEQFYYHENQDNLSKWGGDNETLIDRFDARALLDFIPELRPNDVNKDAEEEEVEEELQFERFRDLVENKRLNRSEEYVLSKINDEWNELLISNNAKLQGKDIEKEKNKQKSGSAAIAYDYGTNDLDDESDESEDEYTRLNEEDLLTYVYDLTEKEVESLNETATEYGIRDHYQMLRIAKKEVDEIVKQREQKQLAKSSGGRRRRRRRNRSPTRNNRSYGNRRASPVYDPYPSDDKQAKLVKKMKLENIIAEEQSKIGKVEFITEIDVESDAKGDDDSGRQEFFDSDAYEAKPRKFQPKSIPKTVVEKSEPEKKLSPMERLKLLSRSALEKQIRADGKKQDEKLGIVRPEIPQRPKQETSITVTEIKAEIKPKPLSEEKRNSAKVGAEAEKEEDTTEEIILIQMTVIIEKTVVEEVAAAMIILDQGMREDLEAEVLVEMVDFQGAGAQ